MKWELVRAPINIWRDYFIWTKWMGIHHHMKQQVV